MGGSPLAAAGRSAVGNRSDAAGARQAAPRAMAAADRRPGRRQPVHSGFDAVVLALPSPQAHALLLSSQQGKPLMAELAKVSVAPCWTLMLAFPQAMQPTMVHLGPHWNAARSTHHRIAWLARESSKPGRSPIERWTVQASPDWSQRHLEDDAERVKAKLLKAFTEVTGIRAEPPHAVVHRWRHAQTLQPLGKTHVWDAKSRIGACGDWCLGHRVEDGFVSGLEMALDACRWPERRLRVHRRGRRIPGPLRPSPTGPLHAGSLVAALASWLDARAHQGRWLVRIEDVDTPRCVPGADRLILEQLAQCGLVPDEPPVYQSQRGALYQQALDSLTTPRAGLPLRLHAPGHRPRAGGFGPAARAPWRTGLPRHLPRRPARPAPRAPGAAGHHGRQRRHLAGPPAGPAVAGRGPRGRRLRAQARRRPVGLPAGRGGRRRGPGHHGHRARRRPGRQHGAANPAAARAGLAAPRYLHTPLVLGANGEKLSKQNGAQALDTPEPLAAAGTGGRRSGPAIADQRPPRRRLAAAGRAALGGAT
jgi:hypothetical protein